MLLAFWARMSLLKLRTWAVIATLVAVQVPSIAAAAGKKARVDRQIEDIETQGKQSNKKLRLIVQPGSNSAVVLKALKSHGVTIRRQGRNGRIAVEVSGSDLQWLETTQGIDTLSFDAPVAAAPLANSEFVEGATFSSTGNGHSYGNQTLSANSLMAPDGSAFNGNELRALLGIANDSHRGAGVGVAVIDSGIAAVPDLAGKITAFYDFTNGQGGIATTPVDGYGHGTHVAGLIAGSGSLSNGQYEGVAPDAHLIGLRVLDSTGSGSTSDVIAAVEFATANKATLGIDVINLSLGHPPYESATTDPLVQAVQAASQAGIVVVVSAGNVGVNPVTNLVGYAGILSPGNAPSAITVGSAKPMGTIDPSDDLVANYSSRGPSWYDGYAKPDLAVPGQMLLAPAAPGSFLVTTYPSLLTPDGNYIALSGTSMAAGVESGLVAVVLEANRSARLTPTAPDLTPNAIKAFMEYTAFPMHDATGAAYDRLTQGAGRANGQGVLSLAEAVDTSVPTGSPWLMTAVLPFSTYDGVMIAWAQNIVWGANIIWVENIIWGDNIVWGDNIIWGESSGNSGGQNVLGAVGR